MNGLCGGLCGGAVWRFVGDCERLCGGLCGGAVQWFAGVCERRAVGCAAVLFGGLGAFVNGCAVG
ncbi:hypothetical protein [uncultured Ruminococcus sp.]|uniref:hypothetical protein n=1 Tax=uncultured Ruminococcus sp. TaxID=165186 RepID=UPI0025E0F968|nr:hypothetical protein [uncultured Ruminococcus sp.]